MVKIQFSLQQATVRYIGTSSGQPAALERMTLDILQGSWTAIVGQNGSGKSTLSKVLSGVAPLTEGRRSVAPESNVHIVMQHPETQILGETIEEELTLCASAASVKEPSAPGGERLGWEKLLRELGLGAPLHTPVKRLSGGQKQLLNVAGCLAAGADCIVFDESTSMLDPASRQAVLDAAAALHRSGRTVVWTTHRMEEVARAERVLAMEGGRLAFDGTPEQFFYADAGADTAPCDRLGFQPPYAVSTARALLALGYPLQSRPLLPESLAKAVTPAWPSKSIT